MKNISQKTIAVILSVLLAVLCYPASALALGEEDSNNDEEYSANFDMTGVDNDSQTYEETSDLENGDEYTPELYEEAHEVDEDVSKRTENSKTYNMSDGTHKLVLSSEPMHYLDENGFWKDFDNTIRIREKIGEKEDGKEYYSTGSFDAAFSIDGSGDLVKIADESHSITFSPKESRETISVKPVMRADGQDSTSYESNERESFADDLQKVDSLIYESAFKNAGLKYYIKNNEVKEEIVIESRSESYEYSFILKLEGLTANIDESGRILLLDAATGEEAYIIPSGYMIDSNDSYSNGVKYTLEQVEDDIYSFTVTADSDWINSDERTFPVVVDPTVLNVAGYSIKLLNSEDNHTNLCHFESPMIFNGGENNWLFLFYDSFEEVDFGASSVLSSKLFVGYTTPVYATPPTDLQIDIYQITDSFDDSYFSSGLAHTIPYHVQHPYEKKTITYPSGTASFDITGIIESWRTVENNGLLMIDNCSSHSYVFTYLSLQIIYGDIANMKGAWDECTSIGNNTISINGYMPLVSNALKIGTDRSSILPTEVFAVYNENNDYKYTQWLNAHNSKCGKKWYLNLTEFVLSTGENEEAPDYISYYNCFGEVVRAYRNDSTDRYPLDSNGESYFVYDTSGIDLILNKDSNPLYGMHFSNDGLLQYITDENGNRKDYYYNSLNQLVAIITKPVGCVAQTEVTFTYNSSNALIKISFNSSGEYVNFKYSSQYNGNASDYESNYLRQVVFNSGEKYEYVYSEDSRLAEVINLTGGSEIDKVVLSRTGSRVSSIQHYAGTTPGELMEFDYYSSNSVHKRLYTALSGDHKIYTAFDERGNVIRKYYIKSGSDDYPTFSVTNQYAGNNLIASATVNTHESFSQNGYFESSNYWSTSNGASYDTSHGINNSKCMKLVGSGTDCYARQTITSNNIAGNDVLVLGGWVQTPSTITLDGDYSFGLYAEVHYSDGITKKYSVNANTDIVNIWQYVSVIIPITGTVSSIDIDCSFKNYNNKIAYFDNVHLSKAVIEKYYYNSDGKIIESKGTFSASDNNSGENQVVTHSNGFTITQSLSPDKKITSEHVFGNCLDYTKTYSYDLFGHQTNVSVSSEGLTISSGQTYSGDGQTIVTTTDERGKETNYSYNSKREISSVTDPEGNKVRSNGSYYSNTACSYGNYTFIDKNNNSIVDSNETYIKTVKSSNNENQINSIQTPGTNYIFAYDNSGNLSSVGLSSQTAKLAEYEYTARQQLQKITYGNGGTTVYTYTVDNLIHSVYNANSIYYQYSYDSKGDLWYKYDWHNNTTTSYSYDLFGRISNCVITNNNSNVIDTTVTYQYDSNNRISSISETSDSKNTTYTYHYYGQSDYVYYITIGDSHRVFYSYDGFGRVVSKTIRNGNNSTIHSESYEYLAGANNNSTTNIIRKITYGDTTYLEYTYTDNGYISSIYGRMPNNPPLPVASYQYDEIGQLIRENNYSAYRTYLYTYNLAGNITSRKEYTYTTAATVTGTPLSTKTYSYSGDRLVSLNGSSISYDGAGNPLTWNGKSLNWQGRELNSVNSGSAVTTFQYNDDGLRVYKSDYSYMITSYYTYDGDRLVFEQCYNTGTGGSDRIKYIYDDSGITGFAYYQSGTVWKYYTFRKNLQGDVIAIYDSNGDIVATYSYDAWGACTVTDNSTNYIGTVNRIRYRSYYYDSETGWYYLQSRYYDPAVGRFISPDDVSLLGANGDLLSCNLYAYCSNNPIVKVDCNGQFWDYVVDIGFLAWSVADVVNDPSDWKNWVALVVDVVFAVVPFVPSGVGQVIKAGNRIDNALDVVNAINKVDNIQDVAKVTMIGRKMDRVTDTANLIGKADNLYIAWKGYDVTATGVKSFLHNGISMAHNGSWLFRKLRQGYTVIDIGLPTMLTGKGLFYGTERFVLVLWQTRNIWKLPINYYS